VSNVNRILILPRLDLLLRLIFARTESKLQALRSELIDTLTKTQGLAHAEAEDRILVVAGDISVPSDLVRVRDLVLESTSFPRFQNLFKEDIDH
jgi:hypothetical protein